MKQGSRERQLARELYARIWQQRLSAVLNTETISVDGHPTRSSTILLPDGLRLGHFFHDAHPSRRPSVVMILPDRIMPVEFVHAHEMENCRIAVIASIILHASGNTDTPNGRPAVPIFRDDTNDILPRIHSRRPTETYLRNHLDLVCSIEIEKMARDHAHALTFTAPNGLMIIFRPDDTDGYGNIRPNVWASHMVGTHRVRLGARSLTAYANWRRDDAARVLAGNMPLPLAPPPSTDGNARLTRALALCHQALAIDPDLSDAVGTPLRPLLEQHVPDLLRRHREASLTAQGDDLVDIDAELEGGVSRVCRAIDEGLSRVADDRRDALRKQLAFIALRHPDRDGPLEIRRAG